MLTAFESNNWPVSSPQKFEPWSFTRQVDQLVEIDWEKQTFPFSGCRAYVLSEDLDNSSGHRIDHRL